MVRNLKLAVTLVLFAGIARPQTSHDRLVAQSVTALHGNSAQNPAPTEATSSTFAGEITGTVHSGAAPLPGVVVTAANTLTGQKISTVTAEDGSFRLQITGGGRYAVRADFDAFAPATADVRLTPEHPSAQVDLPMQLLSRVQPVNASAGVNSARNGRGFRTLSVTVSDTAALPREGESGLPTSTAGVALPPGMSTDAPTESVAVNGNVAQAESLPDNPEELRQRGQDWARNGRGGGAGGGPAGYQGGPPGAGFGGPGAIRVAGAGRGRGFNFNQPHGSLFYSLRDSALDARPYSLTGVEAAKASYAQQRFGGVVGGPLKIPKLFDTGPQNFFFLSYFGNRAANPFDAFSTVPTLAERGGDFSGSDRTIYDPQTGQPFQGNMIAPDRIDNAAKALLPYIPLPNQPGAVQNFHYVTSAKDQNDNLSLRLIHNFGEQPSGSQGRGGGGMRRFRRNNININFSYRGSRSVQTNAFPTIGGNQTTRGINFGLGFAKTAGKLTNQFNTSFNRNRTRSENLYAGVTDIAALAGISGVSQAPFDWGAPSLQFSTLTGLSDLTPLLRRDQTITVADNIIWNRGQHNWRFGGDFRRIQINSETDPNARGTFVFTGLFTSAFSGGQAVPGNGLDFADFLLGLPQQTSRQFGNTSDYFRGIEASAFIQDDWRATANLSLNLGLRYEYVSPLSEKYNHITNLDIAPDFVAVAPVLPGEAGPYSGAFPLTLLNPDRNNLAPRVGIAWKPLRDTVVRAGYGINYNTSAYAAMYMQLATQPPFALAETLIASTQNPLTLENGFPGQSTSTVTNTYAVDRNYRLGYVQTWNVDIQRQLATTMVLNLDYNGAKGTRLDMLRAPNRGPSGLRIAGVQPFLWESSEGDSILHSASVRLRKRMQHGISAGGTYTFSKSIDNASSIGGGAQVVAQNDVDLAAERGLSSFDMRHQVSADYVIELPWGSNKRWLAGSNWAAKALGDWTTSGTLTVTSGSPYTARVLGSFADVARGTNGTLRADVTGTPVLLANPSLAEFFNVAAFIPPPSGEFGDAGRNTIIGPGTVNFDMALVKNIILRESRALELRAQAFNALNAPEWSAIDTVVNSPTFGRVTTVKSMRRVELSARLRF